MNVPAPRAGDGRNPSRVVGGLRLAAGALVSLALTGWFGLALDQPLSFNGDHLYLLSTARGIADGHGFRWNHSLGLPGVLDNMVHPTFYFGQKVIMWLIATMVRRPETVVNVFYGIGIVLMFSACYWALRLLSIGWRLAWIGGVVFVVTPYFAVRTAMHDLLAVHYSVPAGALLALRLGMEWRRAPASAWERFADPLAWLLVLIVGVSGLYYAFFTTLFVAFGGVFAAATRRSILPAVHAGLLCAGVILVLLITGPGLGLFDVVEGAVSLPRRLPMEQQLYGLVPGDARRAFAAIPFLPSAWTHGVDRLEGTWNEWPGVVLTLVILASPALAVWAGRRAWSDRWDDRSLLVALSAASIVLGMVFAIRGGLGFYFNEIVTPAIRAQNRITPFLTFFALVIVLTWAERVRAGARRWVAVVVPVTVAVALVAATTLPNVGILKTKQQRFLASGAEQGDRHSIELMLDRIHDRGIRRVLQLPVMPWPEAPHVRGFDPYRFELPHILDRPRSPVRWSYGLSLRQPTFTRLLAAVDGRLDHGLAAAAAGLGFDAIVIEKAALEPTRLAVIMTTIEDEVPPQCRIVDDGRRVAYHVGVHGSDRSCAVTPVGTVDSIR